jgi:serine/threonine protein kinase
MSDLVFPPVPTTELSLDRFEIGEHLNYGYWWGSSFSAVERRTGNRVCVHTIERIGVSGLTEFLELLAIHGTLDLPGVVKMIAAKCDLNETAQGIVVDEFMPNGSFNVITKTRPGRFGPTEFSKVIFGVAVTMSHIHARHIVLKSLSPASIQLDERNEPKITNFSEYPFHDDAIDRVVRFPDFVAPELDICTAGDIPVTAKADVYSYALILFAIFTSKFVLSGGAARGGQIGRVRVNSGERFIRQPGIPDRFWELITRCWSHLPEQRPSFAEITKMMLDSDDFVLDGTNLDEYHEYRERMTRESNASPMFDGSDIIGSLRRLRIDLRPLIRLDDWTSQ